MESDELKGLVAQIARTLQESVGNGAASEQEGLHALAAISLARRNMEDSRVHALQQIGNLQEIRDLLNLLFQNSLAAEVSETIAKVQEAITKIENYANHLANRVKEMDKLGHLLEHWLVTEVESAGADHVRISDLLTQYYNKL